MRQPEYNERAAQKESDKLTSLGSSIYWLKAIVFQGRRVLASAQQPTAHNNSALHNSTQRMEEQFFLTACGKAQRWIDPMELTIPEAIEFSELGETIKKVRDEREHDDERYGLGSKFAISEVDPHEHAQKGFLLKSPEPDKKPNPWQKFRMEKADTDGTGTIFTSLSGTLHSGKRMLLGGIVDVEKVVGVAGALIKPLLQEQHDYWDRQFDRMPGSNQNKGSIAESYYIEPCFPDVPPTPQSDSEQKT